MGPGIAQTLGSVRWHVAGNSEGDKVTETTLQEAGIFITLADSGEIISQSPEPLSESGDELYTPQVVYVTRGFAVDGSQVVRKTSQLERNRLVQFPSTPLQTVVTVTGNLAGPSWRFVTLLSLQKATCGLRVGNPMNIPDT
jgi:hypothetical protein